MMLLIREDADGYIVLVLPLQHGGTGNENQSESQKRTESGPTLGHIVPVYSDVAEIQIIMSDWIDVGSAVKNGGHTVGGEREAA